MWVEQLRFIKRRAGAAKSPYCKGGGKFSLHSCHGFGPYPRHAGFEICKMIRSAWSADLHNRLFGDAGTRSLPQRKEQFGGLLDLWSLVVFLVLATTSLQQLQSFHQPVY